MVANDTTLLYAVAPLTGSCEASVAVGFTRTLVAGPLGEAFTLGEVLFTSPLHMFCSQHVASHFSKVSSGCMQPEETFEKCANTRHCKTLPGGLGTLPV